MKYHRILVLYKRQDQSARKLAEKICAWLQSFGCVIVIDEAGKNITPDLTGIELVLVLGGDGTILGVARHLAGRNIPFFGINFGRVGFLTASTPDGWQQKLEAIFSGALQPQTNLVLRWERWSDERFCGSGHAINEIVLGRGNMARLTSIDVTINDARLGVIRSDGLLIASPLGSTAYCASAGGPVLFPAVAATVFLAICPFLSRVSPMILPGESEFVLCPLPDLPYCWCTIDGQEGFRLERNQRVVIKGWPNAILYYGDDARFFQHLNLCALQATGLRTEDERA